MTKLKTPLHSLRASGSLANLLSFDNRSGQPRVRTKPTPTDPRTLPQIYHRWDYQDYAAYWHTLSPAEKQAWETNARRLKITGFNYWMRTYLTPRDDLVVILPLDERLGSTAHDRGPIENHATITGAQHVPGLIDYCLSFDGIDDIVKVPRHTSLQFTTALTIQYRIKAPRVAPTASAYDWITVKPFDYYTRKYEHHSMAEFQWNVYLYGLSPWFHGTGYNVPFDEWVTVCCSYGDNTVSLFINGEYAPNYPKAVTGTLASNPNRDLYIGYNQYKGLLDHFELKNRAISQTEAHIAALRRYP